MSKELGFVLDQMSREKGISKTTLVSAIESGILTAAKRRYNGKENIGLKINPKTGSMELFEIKLIVKEVSDKETEISYNDIKDKYPDYEIGDTINLPIQIKDFGRIAAQTARQVIFQKLKDAERSIIYDEFKEKIGQIVSGKVLRKEKNIYYISIGKTEAILAQNDTLPGETLRRDDIIKAILLDVKQTSKGPAIMLSRTSTDFVSGLFKMEVPEIQDGIVVIKGVAREPGERTKIAVYSNEQSIDAVGACVGMKGTRVQAIVRELKGERIDIIPWSEDSRNFIAMALTPAKIDRVGANEEEKTAMVIASDDQLSLAIGKKGQNIKLAKKLTGWEIDVISETEYSSIKMEEADKKFNEVFKKTNK
ncbi:MAG TPA: transcription termination/antitermination protein NusA [Nitrospirae bacterium]|nr:transcription termination/antitermination protein NusA [Nitrospirota bacterium]